MYFRGHDGVGSFPCAESISCGKLYHVLFRYVPEKVGTSIVSYFNADLLLALFGGVLTLGSLQRVLKKIYDSVDGTISFTVIRMVYGSALFMWSIMLLMNGTYNPSIYGNF